MKRITIPEIKKHPWFIKNCPKDLVEGEKTSYKEKESDKQVQSEEEIMQIIQEARIPGEANKDAEHAETLEDDDEDDDLEAELLDSDLSGDFVSPPY